MHKQKQRKMAFLLLMLFFLGQMVIHTKADYHIGYVITNYSNPTNTLYNGDCCGGTSTCVNGGCNTALRLCVRNANHSHNDTQSPCTDTVERSTVGFHLVFGKDRLQLTEYYFGAFQIYIRVSHKTGANADFDPPFSDPLIDDIFIEANVTAVLFTENIQSTLYTMTGDFGRATMTLAVNIQCAENYFGSACQFLCNPDGTRCIPVLSRSDESLTNKLPITDWVIVGVVTLMIVGVIVGIIGDHIVKSRKTKCGY